MSPNNSMDVSSEQSSDFQLVKPAVDCRQFPPPIGPDSTLTGSPLDHCLQSLALRHARLVQRLQFTNLLAPLQ